MKTGWRSFSCLALVLLAVSLLSPFSARAVKTQLVVAMSDEMAPLQFLDEDGQPAGMHVELLEEIARQEDLLLEYKVMDNNTECVQALRRGEADLILGVVTGASSDLLGWYTEPFTALTLCAIAPADRADELLEKADYNGKTASFEYGSVKYSYMYNLGLDSFLATGSQGQALEALSRGRSDLAIGVRDCFFYQLDQMRQGDSYTIVRSYMGSIEYAAAVQPGNERLLNQINEELIRLRASGIYDEIYNRWRVEETRNISDSLRKITRILFFTLAAAGVLFLLGAVLYVILKKQLRHMTRELSEANEALERHVEEIQQESVTRQHIIDSSPASMLLFSRQGNVTMLNRAACRMADISEQRAIGAPVLELWPYGEVLQRLVEGAGGGAAPLRLQNQILRLSREGEERALALRCSLLELCDGGSQGDMLLTAEDITPEEERNRELLEAEKSRALNRVVASIAHEIRNPLMSIRTFATMIRTEGDSAQFQEAFGEVVPAEVDRINSLVDRFINYAKPSDERQEVVQVKDLVADCLYLTHPVAKRSPIRFVVDTAEGLCVRVAASQMKQVIINIIINGIESMERRVKLSPPEGKLTMEIRAEARPPYVVLTIRDEGVGMSREELAHCLDPYFTTKSTGTGLGLTLSRDLVNRNGGELTIESQVMDHTTITMKFLETTP